MMYYLSEAAAGAYFSWLHMFHYVSVRAGAALFFSFLITWFFGKQYISFSERYLRARAREYTPESHQAKNNVPTMGGVLIIATTILTSFIWARWSSREVWLLQGALLAFGLLGGWDDWSKIVTRRGISERTKFVAQKMIATLCMVLWYWLCNPDTTLCMPFLKGVHPDLGWLIIPWGLLIIVATSNAVNLTDGLDGLAMSSLIMNFSTFAVIAYLAGHALFAQYLMIPFAGTAEVVVFAAALVGSCLGFLWYNAYPASLFMGDAGSLSLGGVLGFMALMTKQELLLLLSGGLFVAETLSVILQVLCFRRYRFRLFKMAPLHHHYELSGWQEPTIVTRFSILTFLLCVCALMTLKIR